MLLSISRYLFISVFLFTSNSNELDTYQGPDRYDSCGLLYKDSEGEYFDTNGNQRKLSDEPTSKKYAPNFSNIIDYIIKRLMMNDCNRELDFTISIIVEQDGCLSNFRVISGISECHNDLFSIRPLVDCSETWPKPELGSNEDGIELVVEHIHLISY